MPMIRAYLRTAVLFDKDSTLFDTRQRWYLSPMRDPRSSWSRYSQACTGDAPMPGPIQALRLHYQHHQVHIVSGASDDARLEIIELLSMHEVPYDVLRLKAPTDQRENAEYKVAYAEELRASGIEPVLFYEDWGPAAARIATVVPVIGVNPFYPPEESSFQSAVAADGIGGGL
jgi:hypothetical protein